MDQDAPAADETSYGRRLTQLAHERGDAVDFIIAHTDGSETGLSWVELERRANQIARSLQARVGRGDTVAIVLPNSPDHVLATLATWKLGATVLPLRYDLPRWELDRLLEVAGAAVVVTSEPTAPNHVTPADLAATADLPADPLPDVVSECTVMMASSGSTGSPKLIVTPARGVLMGDSEAQSLMVGVARHTLAVSPLYHVNGFAFTAPGLLEGNRVVLMERFDAAQAVELIEKHQITYSVLVPTMLQRIARLPDVTPAKLASLERLVYGGATIAGWVVDRWLDLIPPDRFMFTYGSSERLALVTMTGAEWAEHRGATGRVVDADVKILDNEGNDLPVGEVGNIYFRPFAGRSLFRYIGTEALPATDDGFRTIGDVGSLDEDGYLYIADRRHDMIISGGANVYPAEVEEALSQHPDVVDQIVIGIPDPEWGHRVHAIVQPRDPARPPTPDELRAHSKSFLASYKVPKTYELVDTMPRSSAGKINRTRLADERAETARAETPG